MVETDTREKLDLAGTWQIAFDPENEGLQGGWMGAGWPKGRSQPVQVPGIWNLSYPETEGIGFYRREFTVPDAWNGKVVLLRFQGVIYRCEVWIDGAYVGSHEGGYTPFSFNVTRFIRFGKECDLVVRVTGLSRTRAIDGLILQQSPLSKQSWYYVYAGIWGEVHLEACPQIACESLHINPDLRRELAQLELSLQNRSPECRPVNLRMKVLDPAGKVAFEQESDLATPPGLVQFTFPLHLPRPLAWSCENPHLYRLETTVTDGDGVDQRTTLFGMRDFTVQNGEFYLNGEPIFIRGVLIQPNYPVNLIVPAEREMMVREIRLAKEAGFNLIRAHIQPAAPGYLDLTDQLGMLVYAETSLAWIKDSPRLQEHGRREVRELIERDRNHPSVVVWGIYNENPRANAINGEALSQYARSLDPTRVIVDDSGGTLAIDQDFGWIDRATVTPAWEVKGERILDVHLYLGSPIAGAVYDWLRKLGTGVSGRVLVEEGFGSIPVVEEFERECRSYRGKIFVSEIGCGGMSDLNETVASFGGREDLLDARELKIFRDSLNRGFRERDLGRVFGSLPNLISEAQKLQAIGNTQHMEALFSNPRISGYVVTQLNDVAYEFHAGLLDLWRHPKLALAAAQQTNQPVLLVLKAPSEAALPGDEVEVDITLVNRIPLPDGTQLRASVYFPGEVVVAGQYPVPCSPGVHPLESTRVKIGAPGEYQVVARLVAGAAGAETVTQTTQTILALERHDWKGLGGMIRCWGQLPESSQLQSIVLDKMTSRDSTGITPPVVELAAQPATLNEVEWDDLFLSVESGGVAIIGALRPDDRLAIQAINRHGVELKVHMGIGSWMGCYHWIPDSPIFAGLPHGGLAMKPYAATLPKYVLSELGGEVQAGSLRNTQTRLEPPAMLWYSDIEALQCGAGTIVFCQYRVFENIDRDPVASRLAFNLFQNYFLVGGKLIRRRNS